MTVTSEARRRVRACLPLVAMLGGVFALASCSDSDNNFVTPVPTGIVTTFKDTNFNFTTLHTFFMPDTVAHLVPVNGTPIPPTGQFDADILGRVRADFLARGYTEILDPRDTTPDFVVLVGASATQNLNAFISFPWFNFWGFADAFGTFNPFLGPNSGIIFPWFPAVGVTSFQQGTLIVTLVPTSEIDTTNQTIKAAWAGVAAALLNGTITTTNINAAIDEMFAQSPYLTASP